MARKNRAASATKLNRNQRHALSMLRDGRELVALEHRVFSYAWADKEQNRPHTTSTVKSLVDRGLVEVGEDGGDGMGLPVRLTDAGDNVCKAIELPREQLDAAAKRLNVDPEALRRALEEGSL